MPIRPKIQAALEEVRPYIQADGGDVEFVSYKDGVVRVRLTGACVGCPSSEVTLREGLEKAIRQHAPEVKEVLSESATPAPAQASPPPQPQSSPFEKDDVSAKPAEAEPSPSKAGPIEVDYDPDAVTAPLRAMHKRAEKLLDRLDVALEEMKHGERKSEHLDVMQDMVSFLKRDLATHMRQEDEVLFPALIPFISWGTPMSVMANEHRQLHEMFERFGEAVDRFAKGSQDTATLIKLGTHLGQHLRDDFYQEENVMFVEADESLTGARAAALREAMDRIAAAAAREAAL